MLLSATTIFLSAFFLFQVQPMFAMMINPWFGGWAAARITAMLFFQAALPGGCLYAHWSIRLLRPKTQSAVHAVLLAASLLLLPVTPLLAWKPAGSEDPVLHILGLSTVSIGQPSFLLFASSPLVHAWHSRAGKGALPCRQRSWLPARAPRLDRRLQQPVPGPEITGQGRRQRFFLKECRHVTMDIV